MADDKLKSMKSLIRAVLMSSKDGVATTRLLADYSEFAGEYLPYKEMGFPSVIKFIESIPDVARIRYDHKTGEERVMAVADESTAHIQKMVSKQRSAKKRKKALPKVMHRRPTRPVVPGRPPRGPRPPPRGPYRGPPYGGPPYGGPPYGGHPYRGPPGWQDYARKPMYPPMARPYSSHGRPAVRLDPYGRAISPLLQVPLSEFGGMWDDNNNTPKDNQSPVKNYTVTVGNVVSPRSGNFHRKVSDNPCGEPYDDRRKNPHPGATNDKKYGSSFEKPPRFQKKEENSSIKPVAVVNPNTMENWDSPEKYPVQSTQIETDFSSDSSDSCEYLELLEDFSLHHDVEVNVDTTEARVGSITGHLGLVHMKGRNIGSVEVFETELAAREQAAKNACKEFNITKENVYQDRSETSGNSSAEAPPGQIQAINTVPDASAKVPVEIKQNIMKILEEITERGLWGARFKVRYTEEFGPAPDDLIEMIQQCTDIARVEITHDRPIIYVIKQEKQKEPEPKQQAVEVQKPIQNTVTPPATKSYSARTIPIIKPTVASAGNSLPLIVNPFKGTVIPPAPEMTIGTDHIAYVTYATSVTEFCIQLESSCCDHINDVLQKVCKNLPKPDPKYVEKGIYCSALYSEDEQWYRAIVMTDVVDRKLTVRFVDYGNIETVSLDNIRQLPPKVVNQPEQAIVCSLYGIKPPQGDTQWSKKSLQILAEFVQDLALIAQPVIIQDGIYDVNLYHVDDKEKSVNQMLLDQGEAVVLSSPPQRSPDEPELLDIPDEKFLDVYVSFLSPITGVMVRLVGDQFSDKLEELEAELESFYKISPFNYIITAGMVCVVTLDSLYHRVKVLSIEGDKRLTNQMTAISNPLVPDNTAECYFLDHGDSELILKEVLKPIDVDLNRKLPYQAVSVNLYGLENYLVDPTTFDQLFLVVAKICVAEVVSRDGKLTVVLYDTDGEEDLNINEQIAKILISEGKTIDLNLFSCNVGPSNSSDTQSVGSNDSGPIHSRTDIPKNIVSPFEPKQQNDLAAEAVSSMQANFDSMTLSKNTVETASLPSGISNSAKSSSSSIYTWDKSQNRTSTPTNGASITPTVITSVPQAPSTATVMPPYVEIPPVGKMLPIYVLWVADPTNFVCLPYDQVEDLERFMVQLNDHYARAVFEEVEPEVGHLYGGQYLGAWYRMIVKEIFGEQLNVYMADYGEYTILTAEDLQPLPRKFCSLPFTAFKGKLHGLSSVGDYWSESSKYAFMQRAQGRSFFALICDKDEEERMISLRLIDTSDENEDVCIDEVLISMNLARRS
ncbi:hypothetical protein LOTGIDRAFT_237885 [Lottia gigantea]|uniref:Tudor domain-containing protein 7 n=1 Tax=Lottia gigantea TaxID=225164 RepID=V4CK92_LOTGI|nr:hypothetical protein LOTGIDRAFT_237885 [Lottia gigantea]ESP02655.1 hypothetical protein LOTGIDRAFT_237885 [Lottia gigantea]